jgi:hypothetical protein
MLVIADLPHDRAEALRLVGVCIELKRSRYGVKSKPLASTAAAEQASGRFVLKFQK